MISADQILAHLVGDYILQSDWMATEKVRQSFAAGVHAICYSLPFLFLSPSLAALAFIVGTHFVIDRWRLARFVVWAKNLIGPRYSYADNQLPVRHVWPWADCRSTGYSPDKPPFLAVWLLIIADNTMHLLCNGVALKFL